MAPRHPSPTGTGTGNGSSVLRYKDYYFPDGDVTFRVENALFRLHKYFFHRESVYFQTIFRTPAIPCNDPPGSSDTNPVVLKDVTIEAFAGLCWVFYNPKYSVYTTTVEKWVDILALAQKWAFKEVEQLCIRELQKLPIPSVEKIHIYQTYGLDRSLLASSFVDLTIRPDPLNLEEGDKLGIKTTILIMRAREDSRATNSGSRPRKSNGSELRSIIQKVFDLEETFDDFFTDSSPPPPPPQPQPPTGDTSTRKPKN